MRTKKIKHFRRLVARNFARIDNCCGTDSFRQVCKECNIHKNMLSWALNCLAREFSTKRKSINFVVKAYWTEDDGSLLFKVQARTTKERVFLEIPVMTVDDAREWQDKITQSARQSDKKK